MEKSARLTDQAWVITSVIDNSAAIDITPVFDGDKPKVYQAKQDKMSQVWKTKYDAARKAYRIISVRNDKFSLGYDETKNALDVAMSKEDDDAYFWEIEEANGFYNIINHKKSELLLEVRNSDTADGTLVTVGPQTNERKQFWQLTVYQRSGLLVDINGDALINGRKYKALVDQNSDESITGNRQLFPSKPVQKNIYISDSETYYYIEFDMIEDNHTRIYGQYDYNSAHKTDMEDNGEERANYTGYWNGEGHRPIFPDGRIYVRASSWSYFKLAGNNGFGYTLSYHDEGENGYHEVGVVDYYNSLVTDRNVDYKDSLAQFNFVPANSQANELDEIEENADEYLLDNNHNPILTGRTYAIGYKNPLADNTWYNLGVTKINGESLLTRSEIPVVLNNKDRYQFGFRIYSIDSFVNDIPVKVGASYVLQEMIKMDNQNYQMTGNYMGFDDYEVKIKGSSSQLPVQFIKDESGKGIRAFVTKDADIRNILASTWQSSDVYVYVIDPEVNTPIINNLDTLLLYPVD